MSFVSGIGIPNLDFLYGGMPRVPREGEEIYAQSFDVLLGGGAPATMINLQRLGVPVKLSTYLGKDRFSQIVEHALTESGVCYQNLYTGNGMPITVTTAILTAHDRTFISYHDPVEITAQTHELVYQQARGAKVVSMHAGYLPVYQRLKAEFPQTKFTFDTGWEDNLSIDRYRGYLELADLYTPNQAEAMKITGTESPQAAADVLHTFFDHVIVKLDRGGCLVQVDGVNHIIPPLPNVTAVDATGAGDAFLSGLIYGLYHDYDLFDCVRFGNVMGGFCVQKVGCLTHAPTQEQLLTLAKTLRFQE